MNVASLKYWMRLLLWKLVFKCQWQLCFWFIRVPRYFQQLWDCAAAGLLFCLLINTVGIFFLSTELWNVFRGSGSGYSGTVSETGVRMTEYLNPISPPALCPIRVLLSSLSVSLSLSHSAPLAVTTHFQCHNEKCQISWILLISKDTFPVMHHYAWNHSYSLFMSFFSLHLIPLRSYFLHLTG